MTDPLLLVKGRTEYPVTVEAGLLSRLGPVLGDLGLSRFCIVTDTHVDALYRDAVRAGLPVAAPTCVCPAGESHKTLETCRTVYDFLVEARADRGTALLALGGGVIGDMAGFAAATYMRGLPLVQVPTTLLAMVDSSIGGKVAVDLPQGKNLVGAFYDPRAVLADPSALATLPPREVATGMAEIIKAGIIASPELFQATSAAAPDWESLVRQAAAIKAAIVTRDPFERDERMHLNLGHTLGHALEAATAYGRLTHGEAVAIGLVAAVRLSREMGVLQEDFETSLEAVLNLWNLPTRFPRDVSWPAVEAALLLDKKKAADRLRYVLPVRLGSVTVADGVTLASIREVFLSLQQGELH